MPGWTRNCRDHQRQGEAREQPADRDHEDQQTDRARQYIAGEEIGSWGDAAPEHANDRPENLVQEHGQQVDQRESEQDGDPLEHPDAEDARARQEPLEHLPRRSQASLRVMRAGTDSSVASGEQPDQRAIRARYSLEDHIDVTCGALDGSYEFQVGLRRISLRAIDGALLIFT